MGVIFTKEHDSSYVLSLCRERKRLLKLAVRNRDAFAVAQCKYNNSLLTLSKAVRLFVAKHSFECSQNNDKTSTFPPQKRKKRTNDTDDSCPYSNPADSLASSAVAEESQTQEQKTQVDRKQKGIIIEEEESERDNTDDDEIVCKNFYDEKAPEMPSVKGETSWEWNFFDPYANSLSILGGNSQAFERNERELKDIPDLGHGMEEVLMCGEKFERAYKSVVSHGKSEVGHVKVEGCAGESSGQSSNSAKAKRKPKNYRSVGCVNIGNTDENENVGKKKDSEKESEVSGKVKLEDRDDENLSSDETKDLTVTGTPKNGRDLLKALKEIEGLFHTACDAGLDVSKMMEATRFQLRIGLTGTENSSNIFWLIVRNRQSLNHCSCCQSVLPPPSTTNSSSPRGTKPMQTLVDENPGMQSGSHSLSMGKLYQWERKLYQGVKMGEKYRKLFERKCVVVRRREQRGEGLDFADKTRLKVKALQARIWVAVDCAQAISSKIVKVRDEEIEPQLFELLRGLTKMWKIMTESHETQSQIMVEVASFNSPNGNFCSYFHRHATIKLELELKKWRACFSEYVCAQKAYVESLDAWFSLCCGPESEVVQEEPEVLENSEEVTSAREFRLHETPVISVCHEWLASMGKLPDKAVMSSLKNFRKEIKALSFQQDKEQKQKKKVDGLVQEFDRKVSIIQRDEKRILKLKESKTELDRDFQDRMECLEEKKTSLEEFKQKIELERAKHISGMEETQRATLAGFQTGFPAVLESLVEFSKATVNMYDDLLAIIENLKPTANQNSDNKNPSK